MKALLIALFVAGMQQSTAIRPDALVEGIVTGPNAVSVADAQVALNGVRFVDGTVVRFQAMSDERGRFSVKVPAGVYSLLARSPAYATPSPATGGAVVTIASNAQVRDVELKLFPQGTLKGRVSDGRGRPLFRFRVEALAPGSAQGRVGLTLVKSTTTDDLGQYRLFGLDPGLYHISVVPPASNATTSQGSYVHTYYPGVLDLAGASRLRVESGAEVVADIGLQTVATVGISGKVTNPTGQFISMSLVRRDSGPLRESSPATVGRAAVDRVNGQFNIIDVPPGSYTLMTSSQSQAQTVTALANIEVNREDVDGLSITLRSGVDVRGRLTIKGQVSSPPTVSLTAEELTAPNRATFNQRITGAGAFVFSNVPAGRYRVVPGNAPEYYVSNVRVGGVATTGATITVGPETSEIEVIMDRGETLRGDVVNRVGTAVAEAVVVLTPRTRGQRQEMFKITRTDPMGRFTIAGVAPGDYVLLAADAVDTRLPGPEFLDDYMARGTNISVAPGLPLSIQLPLISADGNIFR